MTTLAGPAFCSSALRPAEALPTDGVGGLGVWRSGRLSTDVRPQPCDFVRGAGQLIPGGLEIGCETISAPCRSSSVLLRPLLPAKRSGETALEHPTVGSKLVDVGMLVSLSLAVGPRAVGFGCPLPRATGFPQGFVVRVRHRHDNNRTSRNPEMHGCA